MTKLIFLGGMGRSGTNLLRNILDTHSAIASGPEFNHLESIIELYRTLSTSIHDDQISSYVDQPRLRLLTRTFIDDMIGEYARKRDKEWLVEKTPSNIWFFLELSHLFPEAKFIQLIRDGRDVCCSHREVGKRMIQHGRMLSPKHDSALINIFYCAALWSETIKFGLQFSNPQSPAYLGNRILTVRYEDLVTNPERVAAKVCSFLGVPFEERMLHPEAISHDTRVDNIWVRSSDVQSPISPSSVDSWRHSMNLEERILFTAKGLEGLSLAGYSCDPLWCFEGLNLRPNEIRQVIEETHQRINELGEAMNQIVHGPHTHIRITP